MLPSPPAFTEYRDVGSSGATARRILRALLLAALLTVSGTPPAHAGSLARGTAAFDRADYVRAFYELSPLAERGDARALALLGYMYEHGYGAPQAYEVAANFYGQSAVQGDPFAQAMLGLMYDKGHGVSQDFVLAYKWLNLAAARTRGRQRQAYAQLRDAVASKLSKNEIVAGQRLAVGARW
jgi:TPR repeat protein